LDKGWLLRLLNVGKDCRDYPKPSLLIGNKSDLKDERVVLKEEALEMANSYGLIYIETSAKTRDNLTSMVAWMIRTITTDTS